LLAPQERQNGIRALSTFSLVSIFRLALRNCSLPENSLRCLKRLTYSGCVRKSSEADSSMPTFSLSISYLPGESTSPDDHRASLVRSDLITRMSLTTRRLPRSAVNSDSLCQDRSARRTGTVTILKPRNDAEAPMPPPRISATV